MSNALGIRWRLPQLETATGWTGETACALQAALRMSNETFARHLQVSPRTVAGWHEKPEGRGRSRSRSSSSMRLSPGPTLRSEIALPCSAGNRHSLQAGLRNPKLLLTTRLAPPRNTGSPPTRTSATLLPGLTISRAGNRAPRAARWRRGSLNLTGAPCSTGPTAAAASDSRPSPRPWPTITVTWPRATEGTARACPAARSRQACSPTPTGSTSNAR